MPKLNDKEILNEITEVQKRWLLQALKHLNTSEIINYEYHIKRGLREQDNIEIITITRKPKRLKLEKRGIKS